MVQENSSRAALVRTANVSRRRAVKPAVLKQHKVRQEHLVFIKFQVSSGAKATYVHTYVKSTYSHTIPCIHMYINKHTHYPVAGEKSDPMLASIRA